MEYNAKVLVPRKKYDAAMAAIDEGNYQEAYDTLIKLGDYEDAAEQAEKIRLPKNKAALKDCEVGDYVTLGLYEQDNQNDTKYEEIEWQVLETRDNKALVISRYVIDAGAYHAENCDITWEKCSLRKWLNEDFINTAFNEEEQKLIAVTDLPAENKPTNSSLTPVATQDKAFILTVSEAEQYFPNRDTRKIQHTTYTLEEKEPTNWSGCGDWWLRGSEGHFQNVTSYVDAYDGDIVGGHQYTYVTAIKGVRPVMWIDLSNLE